MEYHLQSHQPSGETYLLCYDAGNNITGVCGPLSVDEWSDDGGYNVKEGFDPGNANFEAEDAEWANAQEWSTSLVHANPLDGRKSRG